MCDVRVEPKEIFSCRYEDNDDPVALSYVPDDYEGPCALSYEDREQRYWAIFPSPVKGEGAASLAGGGLGGYHRVMLFPVDASHRGQEHFEDSTDWMFDGEFRRPKEKDESERAEILRTFLGDLISWLARHPQRLMQVEWRDLERMLGEVFDGLGYDVVVTRSTKDGGYDLRLEIDRKLYLIELKHWNQGKLVGVEFIEKFTDVLSSNAADGLLLSSSGFTRDVMKARVEVTDYRVRLASGPKIISLCQAYMQRKSGVWVREPDVRGQFLSGTY